MASGYLSTDWLLWRANVVERLSESLAGMERGTWGKEYFTKYPCWSASGEMESWRIGVWIYTNELASSGHISNKDQAASVASTFVRGKECKARKEVTHSCAERNVEKWSIVELERNGSHRSLLR